MSSKQSVISHYMRKRINAFGYAFKGIWRLASSEAHFKLHVIAAVIVVALGIIFSVSATQWCMLILGMAGVMSAEAVNSAIEKVADAVTTEINPKIAFAKDCAAAAVLIFAMAAVAVGLIIFIPKWC